jgi:fluoride exporter
MVYLAVAAGGFLGACARYLLSEVLGTLHGFPIATLLTNLSGSFVLAWFYTITMERMPIHPHLRAGVGTGFIGAFTTFSTINVELWKLWHSAELGLALAYFILTYVGGILVSIGGYALAIRQSRLRMAGFGKEDVV